MQLGISLALTSLRGGSAASYSAEAAALFAAMSVQPDATRKGLIDDLITGLKTDSVWNSLSYLWVMQGGDAADARLDWKNPGSNTLTYGGTMGAGDFTTDRGFTGDAVDKHLDTGINDNTSLTLDSLSAGVWVNLAGAAAGFTLGTTSGSSTIRINPRNASNVLSVRVHSSTGVTTSVADRLKLSAINRPDAANVALYRNGSSLSTPANASTAKTNANITLLRDSTTYASDRIIAAFLGTTIDATGHSNLYTRLNTFLTAIGGA